VAASATASSSPTGAKPAITGPAAEPTPWLLPASPPPATAGSAGSVTVTALDAYGNTATAYAGTVHLSSSDPRAQLPADYTFTSADAGRHTFAAALLTAGSQSLAADRTSGAKRQRAQPGSTGDTTAATH